MKSRIRLLILVSVLLALWLTLFLSKGRISRRNFEKIRVGMTTKEVEDILGPQGDYSTRPIELAGHTPHWMTNNAVIWVWFDSHGRVVSKDFVVPRSASFLEKLGLWLGL
jgi:hypothetical protein